MIFGSISKFNSEIKFLPQPLQEALAFLKKLAPELSKLEEKKYPIGEHDINDVFMTVSKYSTKPWQEKKAEQHRKFIDIHVVVKGNEAIGIGVKDSQNKVLEEYSEEKDRALFSFVSHEKFIILKPGEYAIFFPEDIHRPGCNVAGESFVKKVVVKIKQ